MNVVLHNGGLLHRYHRRISTTFTWPKIWARNICSRYLLDLVHLWFVDNLQCTILILVKINIVFRADFMYSNCSTFMLLQDGL